MVKSKLHQRAIGKTNLSVSSLGFGSAWLGVAGLNITEQESEQILQNAIEQGITYFDTAPLYGHGLCEKRLGRILSKIPRNQFVISSKVGYSLVDPRLGQRHPMMLDNENKGFVYDYSYDGVRRSVEASLKRLQLDRIDILFCHDIDVYTHGSNQPRMLEEAIDGTLPALADLRSEGVIDAFGVGVNEWEVCDKVCETFDVDCFLLAGRFTLLEQEPLQYFLPKCVDRGISVIVGGPYNSGLLVTKNRQDATYNYKKANDKVWEKVQSIRDICGFYGVELAAAALQYPLRHQAVSSVIPGIKTKEELSTNLIMMEKAIPESLWAELDHHGHVKHI